MTYPTVLLHLEDDARAGVRIDHATRLALRFSSHLVGLSCHRPAPWPGDAMNAALGVDPLTNELLDAAKAALAREETFRRVCDSAGVLSFETLVDDDEPSRALARQGRCSDLVILGQADPAEPSYGDRHALVEAVVLLNARPTLVLPYAGRFDNFGERILVAWDGSREAARAVADALPMLARAAAVHLVHFDFGTGVSATLTTEDLEPVVRWLSRHGITARASVAISRADAGNALLSHASDVNADLLVMGAWGQSRLSERLLGGATRTVLQTMTVPTLLSH